MNNMTFYMELLGLSGFPPFIFEVDQHHRRLSSLQKGKKDFLFETDHGLLPSLFLHPRNTPRNSDLQARRRSFLRHDSASCGA